MPNALRNRAWLLLAASITLQLVILRSVRVLKHDFRHTLTEERGLGDREGPMGLLNLFSLSYDDYYFAASPSARPWILAAYLLILCFLFSFIGICASDFFCPNLSTIATYLGLSESTAGVTFLAFGNGSPDVFSTFAALKDNTFGLAVGELIGAASFIISIVVGSIALIRPFHVPRYAFLRDTSFFTCAVIVLITVLHDGHLTLWESGGMVGLYLLYVVVVIAGNWFTKRRRSRKDKLDEEDRLLDGLITEEPEFSPPRPSSSSAGARQQTTPLASPVLRPKSLGRLASSRHSQPPIEEEEEFDTTPRAAFSLLGAIEFRDVVNSLRRTSSREGSPARSPVERIADDYFGNHGRGHRRSSSYNPVSSGASTPATPGSSKGRRRAASHAPIRVDPHVENGPKTVPPSIPPPIGITPGSPEVNPWTDQIGRSATPASLAPPGSPERPVRPQIQIPRGNPPSHISIPTISVIDPTGHAADPDTSGIQTRSPNAPPHESKYRIRRRIRLFLHVLFPSMRSFRHKSIIGMIVAVFSVPAVLLLTVTLPVVDDGRSDEGGVALPVAEDEPFDTSHPRADDSSGEDEDDSEDGNRRLSANVGEELHHLVETGFSPLHSPLGRIRHSVMKRTSLENLEDELAAEEDPDEEERKELLEEIHSEEAISFYPLLTAAQCVLGPLWCCYFVFQDMSYLPWVILGIGLAGLAVAVLVMIRASDGYGQPWRLVRCFSGFICSMVWIAAIADEVVSVLQALGEIMGLSDAIIGLTIFAVGNSLADLVANVIVAQFAPAMAYAACFGGPMLNLLLGIGGSGTYHMFFHSSSHTPVNVNFSPTLWVSASGLVLMLVGTAIFVPLNGYRIDRRWACCLIVGYIVLMCVNVGVELKTGRG